MIRTLLLLVISFVLVSGAWAQTITSSGGGSGAWSDPLSWTPNTVPTAANSSSVVIANGHTINITANLSIDQVTIQSGGTLIIDPSIVLTLANGTGDEITVNAGGDLTNNGTIAFGPLPNRTVVVNGDFNNNGAFTGVGSAKLFFNSGSNYFHQFANGGTIPVASWNANSTVNIVGYASGNSTPPSGLSQTFGNFVWNAPNQDVTISLGGLPTSLNGDFRVLDTGIDALFYSLSGSGPTVNIGGSIEVSGGVIGFASGDSGPSTWNIAGNFEVSGGYVQLADDQNLTANITGDFILSGSGQIDLSATLGTANLNVQGNYTHSGGDLFVNGGVGNVNFTGASTKVFTSTIVPAGNVNYSVASLSTLTLSGSNFIGGGGTFTLNGTMQVGSTHAGGALQTGTANGNLRVSGTRTFASNSTIVYNGSAAQFIGNGFPSGSDVNLTINNASGVSLSTSLDIVALRTLTLTSGNISIGTQTLTINGTVTGSGGLVGGPSSNLVIGGTGDFGTLTFNGTTQLNNFTLNRTGGAGLVTLGGNLTVLGTFTHTTGTLAIGSNTLTISGAYGPSTPDDLSTTSASTLIINGTGTLPSDISLAGGALGTLTMARASTSFTTTSTSTLTNLNLNAGTFANGTGISMAAGGTVTRSGGTMNSLLANTVDTYNVVYTTGTISSGPELPDNTTALANLSKTGSGTLTLSKAITINGILTLSNGTFNAGSNAIDLKGNFVSNAGSTLTSGTITFSGTTAISGSATPTFGSITITGALTPSSNFQINGNLVNNGTLNAGTATTTFGGTTTISGSSTSSFNNIVISGSLTAPTGTFNVAGNWTNNGTFNNNNGAVNFNGTTTIAGSNQSNFFTVTVSGTLTAPTSSLGIAGNFTNNGTFNNNGGTVVFNGTVVAQTVSGSATTFNNVTVSNPVTPGVQITNTSRLNGTLTLTSGAFMDADGPSGTGVFIVSSTSQTVGGRIATLPNPTNLTGQVTIERYIHGKTGGDYRYLSMPITTNANLSIWRNSIHVTGNFSDRSTNADNSNIADSGNTNPSVFTYNSTTQAFTAVNGTGGLTSATSISSRLGYSAYDFNNGAVTVSYRGIPERGNVPITISNANGNFNLVPNPYPSPLDWDNVVKTNVNDAMYLRVDNNVFSSYVGGVATNAPFGGWTGEISTGQAFWVVSNGGGTTFTLREADKTGNNNYFLRTKSPDDYFRISLNAESGRSDEIVIRFADNASDGYDPEWDASKLKNDQLKNPTSIETTPSFNLSSYVNNPMEEYAINSVAKLTGEKIINLNVADVEPGEYVLKFSDLALLSSGYRVVLVDYYGRKETDITDGSEYAFQITEEKHSTGMGRFYLRINGEPAKDFPPYLTELQVYPNPTTDYVYIELSEMERNNLKSITLLNAMGANLSQENYDSTIRPSGKQVLDLRERPAGLYLIAIQLGEQKKVIRVLKR